MDVFGVVVQHRGGWFLREFVDSKGAQYFADYMEDDGNVVALHFVQWRETH